MMTLPMTPVTLLTPAFTFGSFIMSLVQLKLVYKLLAFGWQTAPRWAWSGSCGHFLGRLFDRVNLIKPVSNVRLFVRPWVPTCVRAYVRPSTKTFFDFNEIWHVVEVDDRSTRVCSITISKVKVTSPLKLEIRPFSKVISAAIYNAAATDHGFLN